MPSAQGERCKVKACMLNTAMRSNMHDHSDHCMTRGPLYQDCSFCFTHWWGKNTVQNCQTKQVAADDVPVDDAGTAFMSMTVEDAAALEPEAAAALTALGAVC